MKNTTLEIYNATGQKIQAIAFSNQYEKPFIEIDLHDYNTGIYFYKIIINAKEKVTGKFVKI